MQTIKRKLSELIQPEKNVRIHTDKQLQEFEKSVRMFGQIRPIVIDENNVILAGNGLYETLIRMGESEADIYQYTDLTGNQKKKLMIADNKIFSLGIENLETLNTFLDELHDDLDIPGYDSEILRQMVSEAEDITEKLSEYGTLDESEITAINEHNEKREAVLADESTPECNMPESNVGSIKSQSEPSDESEEESADIKKLVICPACGEKIWL